MFRGRITHISEPRPSVPPPPTMFWTDVPPPRPEPLDTPAPDRGAAPTARGDLHSLTPPLTGRRETPGRACRRGRDRARRPVAPRTAEPSPSTCETTQWRRGNKTIGLFPIWGDGIRPNRPEELVEWVVT